MSHRWSLVAARPSAIRDDLPAPGSPSTQTTPPMARPRASAAERRVASSCPRPTHVGGRSAGHAVLGSGLPSAELQVPCPERSSGRRGDDPGSSWSVRAPGPGSPGPAGAARYMDMMASHPEVKAFVAGWEPGLVTILVGAASRGQRSIYPLCARRRLGRTTDRLARKPPGGEATTWLNQARAQGQAGKVGTAPVTGLVPDAFQVRADRADADVQMLGDLGVGVAPGDQGDQLPFPGAEPGQFRRCPGLRAGIGE